MKLCINREALIDALNHLREVVKVRTLKPALTCVKLIAAGKSLMAMATDMEISLSWRLSQVDINAEGVALVPLERFISVASAAASDTLTLESENGEGVVVKSGDGRFKISGYPPTDHPPIEAFTQTDSDAKIDGAEASRLITKSRFCMARELHRYAINGIQFVLSSSGITSAGTDGHRAAMVRGDGSFTPGAFVVPRNAVALLEKLCAIEDAKCRIQVQESRATFAFYTGDEAEPFAAIRFALLQGAFPPCDDIIRQCGGTVASVDKERFVAAIKQAQIFTTEESKSVRLEFRHNALIVGRPATQIGEASIDLPAEYTGPEFVIGFNPDYLLDYLATVEAERVSMELNTPNKPVRFKADTGVVYVAMPVNLS